MAPLIVVKVRLCKVDFSKVHNGLHATVQSIHIPLLVKLESSMFV